MGKIEVCCQSTRPTIFKLELGDLETKILLGWMSGCRIPNWLRVGSLGMSEDVMRR